ncbi:MAG TPA: HEAT repeat domain-containing protein [Gemmatimonadaceae bacterium]|nr:HEAT repeat domain-containing protein [Gemmatimonadaceae bacterium]
MKCITLTASLLTIATAAVGAQTPPPAPPAAPARPRAAERPTPAPRAVLARPFIDDETFDEMRASARALRASAADMAFMDHEELMAMVPMPALAPMPPMPAMPDMSELRAMPALAPMALFDEDRFEHRTPARGWAPNDPADSLYNLAREVLNRGDWGRAARMFQDLQRSYPKSVYEKDAEYWEAWSRYRIGTTDELKQSAKILEPLVARVSPNTGDNSNTPYARGYGFTVGKRLSDSDILGLYARVNGVLAQRGDADAAAKVAKLAQQGVSCDQEDLQLRAEALSALTQMDPNQALPILHRVLDRKDECSASLRRNAVLILSRRTDPDATALLLQTAKSDPNIAVRSEAVSYLSRVPGDAGVNALEDILKTEQDERIQRAAVRGLMASDNPRARSSMRALLDRKDAALNLRLEALSSYNTDRATADDAAYLRALYARADNDRLKTEIVNAIARVGGPENDQFLLTLVRNNNEPSNARSMALARLARSSTLSTADLAKLYDASAESYDMRSRIINILGSRKDQESTDKLIDIVKNSTVINHRMQAINALQSKKDPRATQALMDILDGKKA